MFATDNEIINQPLVKPKTTRGTDETENHSRNRRIASVEMQLLDFIKPSLYAYSAKGWAKTKTPCRSFHSFSKKNHKSSYQNHNDVL